MIEKGIPLALIEKDYVYNLLSLCHINETIERMTEFIVCVGGKIQRGIGGHFLMKYFVQVKRELELFSAYMKIRTPNKHKFEEKAKFWGRSYEDTDVLIFLEDLLGCEYLIETASVKDLREASYDAENPPPKFDTGSLYAFDQEICMYCIYTLNKLHSCLNSAIIIIVVGLVCIMSFVFIFKCTVDKIKLDQSSVEWVTVGNKVDVFSVSLNKWLNGEIINVVSDGEFIQVRYIVDEGDAIDPNSVCTKEKFVRAKDKNRVKPQLYSTISIHGVGDDHDDDEKHMNSNDSQQQLLLGSGKPTPQGWFEKKSSVDNPVLAWFENLFGGSTDPKDAALYNKQSTSSSSWSCCSAQTTYAPRKRPSGS